MQLSDTASVKEALENKAANIKSKIENQISHLGDDLEGTAKKAAFVLGAIVAVAIVVKVLSPKKPKVKADAQGELMLVNQPESPIVTMIKSAIVTFLLNMARERIIHFLEEMNAKMEKEKSA